MNVHLYCICSLKSPVQQYINHALKYTSSHSVYRPDFSGGEIAYYPYKNNAPMRNVGFLIAESIEEMIALKSKGVHFICLDEALDYDFTDYQFLNPVIMASGPFTDWLSPEYLLTVLSRAISKSFRVKIRLNLGVEFLFAEDEKDD